MTKEENFETFIPYNQNKPYIFVEFVCYIRDENNELNTLVVNHEDEEFLLHWDEYNSYFTGTIEDNGKLVEGYVV